MALPLPTDDAELFAALLASLQTDDAVDSTDAEALAVAVAEAPTGLSAAVDAPDASLELLDDGAAELLDALYEPVLALDDSLAGGTESQAGSSGGGVAEAVQDTRKPALSAPSSCQEDTSRPKRRTRRTNPNKAREEQRRELVALRLQAVEMERQVRALQARNRTSRLVTASSDSTNVDDDKDKDAAKLQDANTQTLSGAKLMDVWRQTCLQQIERRVRAERENARLKRSLASQLEVASAIQSILQKPTADTDVTDALKRRRMELENTPPTGSEMDMEVFAQLLAETDASVERIDSFLDANRLLDVDVHRRGTHVRELSGGVVLDVFSTSLLPYDWHFASQGVWSFYRGSQKHHGPVFGKTAQKIGPSDDAVFESFIMEIAAGDVRADFRIRQVVKRFVLDQQQVVAWTLLSHPTELSNKSLNFGFRESGFVVCRPPRTAVGSQDDEAPPPVTVMQVGYRISPYMSGPPGQQLNLRANINDIAQFMFTSVDEELRAKIERIENLLLDEKRNA